MSTELVATLGLNALLLGLALAAWWLLRTGAAAERRRAERNHPPPMTSRAEPAPAEPRSTTPENPPAADGVAVLDPGWFSASAAATSPPARTRPPRPSAPLSEPPTSALTRPDAGLALRGRGVADLVRRVADGLVTDGYGVRESSTTESGWRADIVATFATDGGTATSGTVVGRISARWVEPWWLVDLVLPAGRPERRLTTAAAEVGFRVWTEPDGDAVGRRGAEQVRIRRFEGG